MPKYYLVEVEKMGNSFHYPEVGHKNYKNAGYNPEMSQCIWVAKESVDMTAEGVQEITKDEAQNLLDQWEDEKTKQ